MIHTNREIPGYVREVQLDQGLDGIGQHKLSVWDIVSAFEETRPCLNTLLQIEDLSTEDDESQTLSQVFFDKDKNKLTLILGGFNRKNGFKKTPKVLTPS